MKDNNGYTVFMACSLDEDQKEQFKEYSHFILNLAATMMTSNDNFEKLISETNVDEKQISIDNQMSTTTISTEEKDSTTYNDNSINTNTMIPLLKRNDTNIITTTFPVELLSTTTETTSSSVQSILVITPTTFINQVSNKNKPHQNLDTSVLISEDTIAIFDTLTTTKESHITNTITSTTTTIHSKSTRLKRKKVKIRKSNSCISSPTIVSIASMICFLLVSTK
ncbi:hypothetical protein I4U23_006318 [Adineta vaga]|nr:hypothetical protein I4U23_006318 [Adineta vaga]